MSDDNRCTTRWYVTTSRADAERLAKVDGTPPDEVKCAPASPLCVSSSWSYWIDEKFSMKTFVGKRPPKKACPIPDPAQELLSLSFGSDSPGEVDGGLKSLITINKVLSETTEPLGGLGLPYAGDQLITMEVEHLDGKRETLYIRSSAGYEGYTYGIFRNQKVAREWLSF